MKPRKLPWGKSPFDDMPHDELLLWARRMYAACTSSRHVLTMLRRDERGGFWGRDGSGGQSLSMLDLVVDGIERRFDHESIYRSFYRYAVDLLFTPEHGFGWRICGEPGCDDMIGQGPDEHRVPCCPRHPDAPMRRITWDDLKPGRP